MDGIDYDTEFCVEFGVLKVLRGFTVKKLF